MLLRVLIGAACVAVIGFVVFAAWDRYSATQAADERAEIARCQEARTALADIEAGRPVSAFWTPKVTRFTVSECAAEGR